MSSVADQEKEILDFWKKNKIFEKSLENTKKSKPYIFYDGPPFATGLPHYGHLLGSITKDLFARYWTMNNRYVRRVWGWDCHGLPIENIAEKELKINSKDEIEKMGVEKFNDFCRKKVLTYAQDWGKVIERIGRWVDMKNAYKTMDNEYIESVWWAFKELYEKDFIYQGEKILMYCPRCSTPLAKAEIQMDNSYKNVKDLTVVVKFKLKEKFKGEDVYAISWTTTPWTLPSNLALTVNPKLKYVYVKEKSGIYLLAKDLVGNFFKDKKNYKIVKEFLGKDLEGKEFEPLFDYFKDTKNAFKILLGDFVTADDGTGIVHTAPNFGEDDYEVCKKYSISIVDSVDEKGKFKDSVKDFSGEYVHDTNKKIIDLLKEENKVVYVATEEHEYPFCYRCESKIIYRAIPAWFVDIQKIKNKILKNSQKINWVPKFLKEGRVKNTIETAPDWNISRNRYWATAIPVWVSEDGEKLVVGSVKELKKYAKNLKGKIDLHKDYLDKIILEKNGKEFKRIPEVLDCWFESGAMTFAQFYYPFENKKFFEDNFPSQFVAEYLGQVRAWFYYMLVLSTILFNKFPFENVVTTGTILGEDGQKMSKSKNNFPDPMLLVDKYGADSLRFYLMNSPVMNAENINFSEKGVEEVYKKVIALVYNSSRFYQGYKTSGDEKFSKSKDLSDKWILTRLNEFGNKVDVYLKDYNSIKACDEIKKFVDDLSTWYIRINRDRFNEENVEARKTLYFVLDNFVKICAPVIPFTCEKVYKDLNGKDSVHLEKYPKLDKKIDENLIEEMNFVREVVSQGLRERDKIGISLKWPLKKAVVSGNFTLEKDFLEIIKSQLNVKEINLKKSGEISVKLDTKMTPELEAEGYSREISRQIQSFRKKLGLNKKQKVKTYLFVDYNFAKVLENQKDFIKERTNSKSLEIQKSVTTEKERFKNNIDFKIKDKKGVISIDASDYL